ncbi:hypothetical protein JTB14_003493 [Gonioctena quinquepunctata]|nr:hypothetical protein JTB14_003493 [Gonioctena quinquepunctata]
MNEELFINASSGTLEMKSKSGFINTKLFCQWLVHFKNHSKPTADNPVLSVLDNHSSYRDPQVIQYCRENHIDLLSFPPHANHKMHSLDLRLFGPLEESSPKAAGLFNAAYANANIQKAQNSFEAAGIYPYNPDQFQDEDFDPSLVTDAP